MQPPDGVEWLGLLVLAHGLEHLGCYLQSNEGVLVLADRIEVLPSVEACHFVDSFCQVSLVDGYSLGDCHQPLSPVLGLDHELLFPNSLG